MYESNSFFPFPNLALQASLDRAHEQIQTQLNENAALCVEIGNIKKSHEQGLVERERILENQRKGAEVDKENVFHSSDLPMIFI